MAYKFYYEGSKFYQILYNPTKNNKRLWQFCQSGEVSPNMATLTLRTNDFELFKCDLSEAKRGDFSKGIWSFICCQNLIGLKFFKSSHDDD